MYFLLLLLLLLFIGVICYTSY